MESIQLSPFRGIIQDIKGRLQFYKQDWINGVGSGFRILVPTTYIFFATALPVIVFGEQLYGDTDGTMSAFETLVSTAICGIIHAVIGGQPLIILGVAEPTVYMYIELYKFAKTKESLGQRLFVAWAAWICVWASVLLIAFAVLGASSITKRFTRIAGELFEALIALLFVKEAVKGMVKEFKAPSEEDHPTQQALELSWIYVNGFFGLLLSIGLFITALKTRSARSWRYGSAWLRAFTVDYGVPLMVVLWTGVSYSCRQSTPDDVPRRLLSPNAWDPTPVARWRTVKDMGEVPYAYILMAMVPAVIFVGVYIFDHSVAAQMAEQETFNLQAPPTHHYDMLLLGIMVLICGLLGFPPCTGLVPQSPMHTKSLAKLNKLIVRKRLVETAKQSIEERATLGELYGSIQEVYKEVRTPSPRASFNLGLKDLKELRSFKPSTVMDSPVNTSVDASIFDPEKDVDALLPVTVNEQRLTNLLQAMLMGACVGVMPLIKRVPVSVLWGYFLYMAIETLHGNQFYERLLLVLTAPSHRYKVLEEFHASFVDTVPFRAIMAFTMFQLFFLLVCFGITWIPRAGVLFPMMVFLLVLIRQYALPTFFQAQHLRDLDAAKYEEAAAIPHERAIIEADARGLGKAESMRRSISDSEILNDITTRGRGELKICSARIEQWAGGDGLKSIRQQSIRASELPIRIVPFEEIMEQTLNNVGLSTPSTRESSSTTLQAFISSDLP